MKTKATTKPKQAGSSRSVDRWQREVQACLLDVAQLDHVWLYSSVAGLQVRLRTRLIGLLESLRKAERR